MALKCQLVNETLGTENLPTDPEGLDSFEEIIKRSSDNDGLVYNFSTTLKFNQRGRDFIQRAYENGQGIEEVVICNIYELDPNTNVWMLHSTGKIKMTNYDIGEIDLATSMDETGFNVDFVNLMDQDVSLATLLSKKGETIPALTPIDLKLQSKTILKQFLADSEDLNEFNDAGSVTFDEQVNVLLWGIMDSQQVITNEILDGFGYNTLMSRVKPDVTVLNTIDAKEAGNMKQISIGGAFELTLTMRPANPANIPGRWTTLTFEMKFYLLHTRKNGTTISETNFTTQTFTLNNPPGVAVIVPVTFVKDLIYGDDFVNVPVSIGDKFSIYWSIQAVSMVPADDSPVGNHLWPKYADDGIHIKCGTGAYVGAPKTNISFIQETTFRDTTIKAYLAYELVEKLVQYSTNQLDCFRSNILGRTDSSLVYGSDGAASKMAFSDGANVRQKPTNNDSAFNFKSIFGALMKSWCLSWGFEILSTGKKIVRIEDKAFFFDKTLQIMDLGEVPEVRKKVLENYYQKQIKIGYDELKNIKQINSIDEFNVGRLFVNGITQVKNELNLIINEVRTSGFETESQRRLTGSTEDSPLDSDKFMWCVLRDGAPGKWKNEQDEEFPVVNGLYDPTTAYNLRISPGRNLRRWMKVLASNITKLTNKALTFSSGTGNYTMESQQSSETAPFKENDPVDLSTTDPLFLPESYTFQWKLTRDQWAMVKARQYGYFDFKDKGTPCQGYIINLARVPNSKKTKFELLKVFR